MASTTDSTEPIKIIGVVTEEVGSPRNDGTRGSGLYKVPIRLSARPTATWSELFRQTWDMPPRFTTMHRPGIASVSGDKIILDGTTLEEVERYHADTLKLVVEKVNADTAKLETQELARQQRARAADEEHKAHVRDAAERIKFD